MTQLPTRPTEDVPGGPVYRCSICNRWPVSHPVCNDCWARQMVGRPADVIASALCQNCGQPCDGESPVMCSAYEETERQDHIDHSYPIR